MLALNHHDDYDHYVSLDCEYGYCNNQSIALFIMKCLDRAMIQPREILIELGRSMEFTCYGTHVTWSFNDSSILPHNTGISNGNVLVINNTDHTNQGYYECRATYYASDRRFHAIGRLVIVSKYEIFVLSSADDRLIM